MQKLRKLISHEIQGNCSKKSLQQNDREHQERGRNGIHTEMGSQIILCVTVT